MHLGDPHLPARGWSLAQAGVRLMGGRVPCSPVTEPRHRVGRGRTGSDTPRLPSAAAGFPWAACSPAAVAAATEIAFCGHQLLSRTARPPVAPTRLPQGPLRASASNCKSRGRSARSHTRAQCVPRLPPSPHPVPAESLPSPRSAGLHLPRLRPPHPLTSESPLSSVAFPAEATGPAQLCRGWVWGPEAWLALPGPGRGPGRCLRIRG